MLDLVKSVFVVTLATGWLAACAQDAVDYRPQTWFHLIGGNVSRVGLTADLEAVKAAGIGGIQFSMAAGPAGTASKSRYSA